ncbi:MAG: ligand-binding protein SH3 [Candidatus Harrisonbacteria bacterium CG10_big_fil_rev_8_21_14_0_10_45_28]|uniref:Ligand-binding protein SH3 n=1 Tax=Candidatus Harrisonbacteria bacterium CG10_big_fil_rev_8_21_14_0_10_45_28 TaxID=1974586 RepID=A0A2H0UP51_9BACT|nr:MAG: ligand-binding protein SH3 [Candidatus Harrisonbacteria bacterium CG10_big_fil_rev_8_21_14_0_10_45_28]
MNELVTFLLAAAPISEIRGALPVAIGIFDMPVLQAYWIGVLGNIAPVFPLLMFWWYLSGFLMERAVFLNRFFNRLFDKTRVKHREKILKYGAFGLFLFVAIPLPITGAWTATVVAFIFGIPFDKAFLAILLGVMSAGLVVLSLTYGVIFII